MSGHQRLNPMWLAFGIAGSLLVPTAPGAAPLLGTVQDVEGVPVYRDSAAPQVFYYPPGKLALATDRAGVPQLSFLQMRYTGTAATGDRGAFRTHSVLSFQVRMEAAPADRLAQVRAALKVRFGVEPLLKPLPIRRVTATLNYLPLAGATAAEDAPPAGKPAGQGTLEEPGESESGGPGDGYWTERVFTIAPDDATSQALWDAFKRGRVLLSLNYAFYSDGIPPEPGTVERGGGERGASEPRTPNAQRPTAHLALADTLAITVDAAKYPDRLRQIDVNDSLPAHYAVLAIACYDFNNSLRPDLHLKVVEIEAKSVTGKPLKREVSFSQSSPDVATASIRFSFAVSLKDGYRYRAREITREGLETVKPWQEGRAWTQLLDATTPPAERPALTRDTEEGDAR